MEAKKKIEEKIIIPEGIEAIAEERRIILKKGEMESSAHYKGVSVQVNGNSIIISSQKSTKRELRTINTLKAHIKNILGGFEKKYVYKLQICAVHFPMNVAFDKTKRELVVKNFLGGSVPRIAKILPGVDVKVEKEIVVLESHDKEAAGQSAANIEVSTRITKRDRRIFQDGLWVIHKAGEDI